MILICSDIIRLGNRKVIGKSCKTNYIFTLTGGVCMTVRKIALIPAYMPTPAMLPMIEELNENDFECIVVNDGSGNVFDDLFAKVRETSVVIDHPRNFGKGAALRTGLTYILGHITTPFVVVTLDADGQHLVSDALRVCERAVERPDALVLGCRSFDGKVPAKSRLGNSITKVVYRLATGVKVSDTQTGLRAFSDRLIKRLLQISGDIYEYETNMLMELARDGVQLLEVPIKTIYIDDNSSSHFSPVQDSFRIYKEIIKFSASSLIGFVTDYLCYILLSILTGSVVFSNIAARVVSSGVNFTINRRVVFKSDKPLAKSAVQYFSLAAAILAVNTLLLALLTGAAGINMYIAKIITECAMFFVSFTVQKGVVFRRKGESSNA